MTPEWPAGLVVYSLALWVLLSGLDDLFLQLVFFYLWLTGDRGFRAPSRSELQQARQKRIAIFVPLWHEHSVIRRMLEHNLPAVRYRACEFFVGVYPNDPATAAEVRRVARRHANVHLAECPHSGPTSKADCLNWIYQRMLLWEEEHGIRFEAVVTHDAEDLIHPESLLVINWCLDRWDMVQVPVLPLPTPLSDWTHGFYCDEFAEFQTKDLPVRNRLGGFVPSTGVGAGFSREVLEALAGRHGNRVFEPESLTEDYESGFRVHALGRPQVFIPPHAFGTEPLPRASISRAGSPPP
jgi:adsorption protein B